MSTTSFLAESAAVQQATEELLFQPVPLGPYRLPHRIVMAPLTRSRSCQPGNIPSALNAFYYAQRASAALIISEASQISLQGQGYAWTPGIHTIHAANGYLLDQFIESSTNHRTDEYGGSIENRARLLMEVVAAVTEIWRSNRVGVRLSPMGAANDISDDDPEKTFGCIARKLSDCGLAYLHIVNPIMTAIERRTEPDPRALRMVDLIRKKYRGTLIFAGGFDHDTAESWLQQGKAGLIAFGRKFLANPDLPERFRRRAPLNADDPSAYYGGGMKGYVDYPTLAQQRGEEPKPCVDERWR